MTNVIWIGAYQRRRPVRLEQYRTLHNKLMDEVTFIQEAERHLEEELALLIAHEFELLEAGL